MIHLFGLLWPFSEKSVVCFTGVQYSTVVSKSETSYRHVLILSVKLFINKGFYVNNNKDEINFLYHMEAHFHHRITQTKKANCKLLFHNFFLAICSAT